METELDSDAFITETASGFANAFQDFTQKITNVAFNLGQTISNFADINLIDQAYTAELNDPRLSSAVRSVVEDAREIVQRAGQAVVIEKGVGPNPFNGAGFNPNEPGTISTATLPEGQQLQAYTLALPFDAGSGGQRVQVQLSGTDVSAVRVRTGGLELTPQNGAHVRRYHRWYESSGHVWQGRFKAFPIEQDDHLLTVLRYIEQNPIRAGLEPKSGAGRVHGTGRKHYGFPPSSTARSRDRSHGWHR